MGSQEHIHRSDNRLRSSSPLRDVPPRFGPPRILRLHSHSIQLARTPRPVEYSLAPAVENSLRGIFPGESGCCPRVLSCSNPAGEDWTYLRCDTNPNRSHISRPSSTASTFYDMTTRLCVTFSASTARFRDLDPFARSAGSDAVETSVSSFQLHQAGRLTVGCRQYFDHDGMAGGHGTQWSTIETI